MQYPIAIAVAFGEVGFQTNSIVIGTKIVIRDMILKILFILFSFLSVIRLLNPTNL